MVKAEPTGLLNYSTVAASHTCIDYNLPDLYAVVCLCACLRVYTFKVQNYLLQ